MSTTLIYYGPARLVGALAQELRERGVAVTYDPPLERRDLGTAVESVVVNVVSTGSAALIGLGVTAFLKRWGPHGDVRVDGLSEATTNDRLEQLDELLASGAISPHEHGEQRSRILGEI